jgi:hypothetical protein
VCADIRLLVIGWHAYAAVTWILADAQDDFIPDRCLCAHVRSIITEFLIISPDGAAVNCERTNTLDKPVLDQETFQQLLAAAYTMQEQNHLAVEKIKGDSTPIVSCTDLASAVPQSDVDPLASPNCSRVRRPVSESDELFWRVATVAAMAAVLALLLVGSVNRLSPLPPGLSLPPEVLQRQLPFRRAQPTLTVLLQNGGVGTKTVVIEPDAPATTAPNEQIVVADQPRGMGATPDSVQKTIVNSNRAHSIYESEADSASTSEPGSARRRVGASRWADCA